ITSSVKQAMKDLFLSVVTRDSETMVQALSQLGFIGKGANLATLESGLRSLLEQFYGLTLGEVRELDYPEVAEEIGKLLYGQPFQIPAQYAFLGRAVSTLMGVTTGLAPDFNFIDCATNYARKFLGINLESMRLTTQQRLSQLLQADTTLLRLPRTIELITINIETEPTDITNAVTF